MFEALVTKLNPHRLGLDGKALLHVFPVSSFVAPETEHLPQVLAPPPPGPALVVLTWAFSSGARVRIHFGTIVWRVHFMYTNIEGTDTLVWRVNLCTPV